MTRSLARMRLGPAVFLLGALALCGPAAAQSENPAAQNELRFQQLEDQVRNLTGQVETQSHQIEVLTQQLEKLRGDTDLRLNDLEGKAGIASPQAEAQGGSQPQGPTPQSYQAAPAYPAQPYSAQPSYGPQAGYAPPQGNPPIPGYTQQPPAAGGYGAPTPLYPGASAQAGPGAPPRVLGQIPAGPVPSANPAAVAAPLTPEAQYQAAYVLIGQGQFGAAEQGFRSFLAQHPKDPLASSAAYWVGHSHYARGDFQNAAVAFADGYKKYPKGLKAPDTLLELGKSLAKLDQVPSACATFAQFDKQFGAGATPAMKKQEQQEKTRLKCG